MNGIVFNIQRYSIHDGPGVRTTVFLKGCNLRCFWCHNPESALAAPEVQFFPEKCIACGACVEVCQHGAQQLQDGQRIYQRDLCAQCMECIDECFSGALVVAGEASTVDEILQKVAADREYYRHSGGGVTFSGGEPLLQREFLLELLKGSQAQGFHCAVDTAGNVPWDWLAEVLPFTDLFLYDIKAFDAALHQKVTGVSNSRILENLASLAQSGKEIWIRIPVIPGVNDNSKEMSSIASYLEKLQIIRWVELLPFHTLGSEKFASLGREYPARGLAAPSKQKMTELMKIFTEKGIPTRCMD
jgi:pyruvate formate lyase activating enzyme